MKTLIFAGISILMSAQISMAYVRAVPSSSRSSLINSIPDRFLSSSETSILEWGCPVSEVVQANSRAEALRKIEGECRAQVRRAAVGKPNVVDVIQTSIIWPDVNVTEADGGYMLHGTFFIETLVLHKLNTGK